MTGFALNLDLTLYFEDLRKYASVYVDSTKCKEVGDVEKHIKAVFKLEDNICLTNKKFLIPRCESIGILQQYETLKVQKCDFYDHQIHKNKKSNPSCDQPALNLIQSDKTIDLSCRPKQRFKINICQNRCILEAPVTPFENSQIGNYPPSQAVGSNESLLDCVTESQIKVKTKNKKRKYDSQNGELEVNDTNLTRILDMSVKTSKKKSKHDFAVVDETPQINVETPINCMTQMNLNQENLIKRRKCNRKKRKNPLQVEDIDLTDSCWENLVSNENNSKKQKSKTSNLNEEFSDGLAKDLSFTVSNNSEDDEKESKQNENVYEESMIRKKRKSENKCNEKHSNDDYELSNNISSKLRNEQTFLETPNGEFKDHKDNINVGSISKKISEDYKRCLEEKVSRLLDQKDLENSSLDLKEDPANLLSTSKATNPPPTYQASNECNKINGGQFYSDDKNFESLQDSDKTKRKRIRKHNKKKKREKRELIHAVGPVLNRITDSPEIKSSPTSSDVIKHIYFNDDDFNEEMKIPKTPPVTSQSHLQGNRENKIQNQLEDNTGINTSRATEDNTGINTSRATDGKTETWQKEFLKMATFTSQPLIFHRSASLPAISDKNDSSSNISSMPLPNSNQCNNVAKELQSMNKDFTNCNGDQTVSNNLEVDLKANIKSRSNSNIKDNKLDFKNVILTDYPVIDKVVVEDFILFKVLKLGENCEPTCSNTILGKVKSAANFPDNISLQIMEGFEECNSLTGCSENEECHIVEMRWSDVVEPRLFYP